MDILSRSRFGPVASFLYLLAAVATIVGCVLLLLDRFAADPDEVPPPGPTTPVAAASPPATSPPTATPGPPGQAQADLAGTWVGHYRCGRGRSGLQLVLTPVEERTFRATLDFYSLPGEPTTANGTYAMRGTHSRDGIVLAFDYWIVRPSGYVANGLSAEFTDPAPTRIEGRVNSSSCSTFLVEKESDEWHTPPA